MIHLFADLPAPTPDELFSWLKVVAALGALWYLGLKIADHYTDDPPMDKKLGGLREEIFEKFTLREDFNSHVSTVKSELETMRTEAVIGRRNLHKDIESMPWKVIQLLKETKGLL